MDALFKAKRYPSTAKRKVRVYAWMNKLVKNSRQSKSLPLRGEGFWPTLFILFPFMRLP